MKVLLIGYGSIGKRHFKVLSNFNNIESIDIVTKQRLKNRKTFSLLEDVDNIEKYDYYIISSETNKHFHQLKYLERHVSNKIIFCEKPLFEKPRKIKIEKNQVYVGYVLRFHPLLQQLKEFLKRETIISVNVYCGSYMPNWRSNIDYRECYSAKKEKGGGVLLDLSHELDYVQWLCGKPIEIKSYKLKISDLEIDSDDLTTFIGKTEKNVILNISIDYFSKINLRRIIVHTLNNSYELDFIKNYLIEKNKDNVEKTYTLSNLERNYMFKKMHLDIFENRKYICSFEEGMKVMKTIGLIQE